MRTAPLAAAVTACLLLSACAGAGNNWPSLARRPAEKIAAGLSAPADAPSAASEAATAPPSSVVTVAAARISDSDKDLTGIETRWKRQETATQVAVATAKSAARDSDAWSAAQLELSRFGKIGAQASDARERLNAIAGDLAVAAANGSDVASSLAATGKLIARADALIAAHSAAAATLLLPK